MELKNKWHMFFVSLSFIFVDTAPAAQVAPSAGQARIARYVPAHCAFKAAGDQRQLIKQRLWQKASEDIQLALINSVHGDKVAKYKCDSQPTDKTDDESITKRAQCFAKEVILALRKSRIPISPLKLDQMRLDLQAHEMLREHLNRAYDKVVDKNLDLYVVDPTVAPVSLQAWAAQPAQEDKQNSSSCCDCLSGVCGKK